MDMKDFVITHLNKDDDISKIYPELSDEIVSIANKIIKSTKSYLVKCQYNKVIWDNRCFSKSFDDEFKKITSNGIDSLNKPVGLVLHGVLEVTESSLKYVIKDPEKNKCTGKRARAVALIRPGDFFGLFEAYADLHGYWSIKSGVTRILITTPLGNETLQNSLGVKDDCLKKGLSLNNDADYDYSELLDKASAFNSDGYNRGINWYTSFLLFDADFDADLDADTDSVDIKSLLQSFTIAQLKSLLQSYTIAQLSSLVRQNPPDSFINLGMLTSAHLKHHDLETNNIISTFDAILRGYIPVFRLAGDDNDNNLLPYNGLVELFNKDSVNNILKRGSAIKKMSSKKNKLTPHVYIPDTITYNSGNVYVYVHNLSKKIKNIAVFDGIIQELSRTKVDLLKGIAVKKLCKQLESSSNGKDVYCAIVTIPDHSKMDCNSMLDYTIYKTTRVTQKSIDLAKKNKAVCKIEKPGIPLPDWFVDKIVDKSGFIRKWPDHFSDTIIIAPCRMCVNCKLSDDHGSPAHGNPASSKAAHHA